MANPHIHITLSSVAGDIDPNVVRASAHITNVVVGEFTAHGKQVKVDGEHFADAVDEMAANFIAAAMGVFAELNPSIKRFSRAPKPTCCGGGPQWGHQFDCPKCPD